MRILSLLIVTAIGLTSSSQAQEVTKPSGDRAGQLAISLNKEKYKKKETKWLTVELYVDVRHEVASKADLTAYSGLYETEGYRLDLQVSSNGGASGSGYDNPAGGSYSGDRSDGPSIKFELRDGRIQGGLLTGIKVYESGDKRKFEAVFVNRTVTVGKNKNDIDERNTAFGLGFLEGGAVILNHFGKSPEQEKNRVFMERNRRGLHPSVDMHAGLLYLLM